MPFASVEDTAAPTTSPLTGIYNMPQTDSNIQGYIGEISSTDPRIPTFLNSVVSSFTVTS